MMSSNRNGKKIICRLF